MNRRIWIAALHLVFAAFLLLAACLCWNRVSALSDVPWGCDLFGHYQIAQEIRASVSEHRVPDFHVRGTQVDQLVAWFEARGLAPEHWLNAVAPQAHHFVARNHSVINQYTPGAGMMLAAFPAGRALPDLNLLIIAVSLALGWIGLVFTWRRQALVSAVFITAAAYSSFDFLQKLGVNNYSATAIILPTLLSVILSLLSALFEKRPVLGRVLAFLAGVAAGLGILVRLPCFLALPGLFFLIPKSYRKEFVVAAALFGFLPLGIYQWRASGAWWATTYSAVDTSSPSLRVLGKYLGFYLTKGLGSPFVTWVVVIGFSFWVYCKSSGERRLAWIVFGSWWLSVLFFCTHVPAVPYYLVPAHLALIWMAAGSVWLREVGETGPSHLPSRAATVLVTAPICAAIVWASAGFLGRAPAPFLPPVAFAEFSPDKFPPELRSPRAWIWSDLLSGAFYSQAGKNAFRITGVPTPQVDVELFNQLHQNGDQEFLIEDGGEFQAVAKIYQSMGVSLEPRGRVFGVPYYLAQWPVSKLRVNAN